MAHLATSAESTPLGVTLNPAHRHDSKLVEATLDAVPPIGRHRRQRPVTLHADKGYEGRPVKRALEQRDIIPRVARRGIDGPLAQKSPRLPESCNVPLARTPR